MLLLLLFAIIAGIVTTLSPCILPVLPLLLAAGAGQGKYRPYAIIIGLIASFSFFTLFLTSIIHLTGLSPNILRYIAIALFILFGLIMLFPSLELAFTKLVSPLVNLGSRAEQTTASDTGIFSGLIFGAALGLVWAPCAGPILAAITTLAATGAVTAQAILLTLAYSVGTALPMFFIMYGGSSIVSFISPYSESIRKIFGGLMICGALAIALHADMWLQQITPRYVPSLGVEDNPAVLKELKQLQRKVGMSNKAPKIGNQAPDFVGITAWLNSPELTMDDLKGKVVLVDFWTYSCINCIRTLPYLKKWYQEYKDKGFVIVGVHTPEFAFEHDAKNVEAAAQRLGVAYPIALDNDYGTWKNYDNRYWPAHYLIDQQGIIREIHFGEGGYDSTENMIRSLLGLPSITEHEKPGKLFVSQSPETYLGYKRAAHYPYSLQIQHDVTATYSYPGRVGEDEVVLAGKWLISDESITSEDDHAELKLNFRAQHVYVVMSAKQPSLVSVLLDDKPIPTEARTKDMDETGQIRVQESRMYSIVDLQKAGRHVLTLQIPQGISLYAFTFGTD